MRKRVLGSVAEQAGLNLTWSKISEDTFSRDTGVGYIKIGKVNRFSNQF